MYLHLKGTEMIKTFKMAGIATDKNGTTKVRYSNNHGDRIRQLQRDGFTNLNYMYSPVPKTKIQLCEEMLTLIQFQNDKQIIEDEIKKVRNKLKQISRKATLFSGTAEELLELIK
jgi:hypothetical protein